MMSTKKEYTFSVPPQPNPRNERLLPHVVDETAAVEPDATWCEIPVSSTSYDAGFRPITWQALANATNGLAGRLISHLGQSTRFETLVYLGPSDPRMPMMVLASIKAGYKLLLSSPRNSRAAHAHLFTALGCRTVVTTTPPPPFVGPLLDAFPEMTVLHIPSLDELLTTAYPPVPYTKTYAAAQREPMLCLHTSGSTGLPKPVVYPHAFVTAATRIAHLPPPDGYDLLNARMGRRRGIILLPLFHIAGVHFGFFSTVMNRDVAIFPLATAPPTGHALGAILSQTPADWAFCVPMQIEDLPHDPQLLEVVASKLELLISSGGTLTRRTGDLLSTRLHLRNFLGSSEHAGFPHIIPKNATRSGPDWPYIELHPYADARFYAQGEGLFELVVHRNEAYQAWQTPFVLFPDLQQFQTKDIFRPHPEQPAQWTHHSRKDDIVVFSNGEKTNAVSFEGAMAANPLVNAALVFGSGRSEAGVLLELVPEEAAKFDPTATEELLDALYPTIEIANAAAPAHARIARSHILVADPEKPFLRAVKGTVRRQPTLEAYEAEITALYDSIDSVQATSADHPNTSRETEILEAVKDVSNFSITETHQNFFSQGLDSLQALRLVRRLQSRLRIPDITPSLIYANPSVHALSTALGSKDKATATPTTLAVHSAKNPTEMAFQKHLAYLQVLSSCINQNITTASTNGNATHQVLVTGASGFLGSHIVEALLNNPSVSHVYSLNRRNLEAPSNHRVTHLKADTAQPESLGLPAKTYEDLLANVTLIIHAAWPVDFLQPLPHFELALAGTTHLLLFAARAARKPSVLFVSSVSAVMNLKDSHHAIAPQVFTDTNAPTAGYGESKHVAERLVDYCAKHFGVHAAIARLGQIAGPTRKPGAWNEKEWLPRLIRSSSSMGVVPSSLGAMADVLDWTPVDEVADIVVELGMAATQRPTEAFAKEGALVFNLVNPRPAAWGEVLGSVQEALGGARAVEPAEWLDQLRAASLSLDEAASSDAATQILARYPAVPLEPFYCRLFLDQTPLRLDTRSAEEASPTLQNLAPVDHATVQRWVQAILTR